MDITGKLIDRTDVIQVSEKFRKREFVIEYVENPQYPEVICFELTQDRCDMVDAYQLGQCIKVHFDLKGRKWEPNDGRPARYFNTLQAWRIEPGQMQQQGQLMAQPQPTQQFYPPQQQPTFPAQTPVAQQPMMVPSGQPGVPAAYPQQVLQPQPGTAAAPPVPPPTQTAPPVPQQGTAGAPHVPVPPVAEDPIPF